MKTANPDSALEKLAAWAARGMMLIAVTAGGAPAAYPAANRLHVLLISEPHDLAGGPAVEQSYLESLGNFRFTYAPVPHAGGDHALDVDGLMGSDPRYIPLRKAALLEYLRKDWDAIFFRPGGSVGQVDGDIQKAMAEAVRRGQRLFWFAGRVEAPRPYPAVDPSLEAMLPYQGGMPAVAFDGADPLAGLGLDEAGISPGRQRFAVTNGFAVVHWAAQGKTPVALVAYRRFEKGAVVGIRADGLIPSFSDASIDGERLWAEGLERLVKWARDGRLPPALDIQVAAAPPNADGSATARLLIAGPAGTAVRVEQDDQRGTVRTLIPSLLIPAGTTQVDVALAPSPYSRQALRAVPLAPGSALSAIAFVSLPQAVDVAIETTDQGFPPAFSTRTHVAVRGGAYRGKAALALRVMDWAMTTAQFREEEIDLSGEAAVERDVDFALDDPDPRAYVAWVRATVSAPGRGVIAAAESKLYRYRPFDTTEKLHLATWHTEAGTAPRGYADIFLKHLKDVGFTAVFGARDMDLVERNNLRIYMEHQATTTLGVNAANFHGDIEGYAERYQKEGEGRAIMVRTGTGTRQWPSAAMNLFSMGEESGYGMWSEAYPWRKQDEAPEECNKWFRYYLQQIYGSDIGRLNAAWGKAFRDWSEVKVWRKYAEPFGWMFMPPPKELEPNLTPYVDTHAFHEWYFEEYAKNMMAGLRRVCPVPTWTLSYDFTFIHYSPTPLSNFYCAIPPECVAVWHAFVRSRTPPPNNPFHLDWMYYEDEAMNNQFLQMGYALGCTYLSTWGHVFNGDLTLTRPGMVIMRTMKGLERSEAVIRCMQPHTDPRIGIYTFDSRWKLVRGRYSFFLQRNGPYDIAMGAGPYKAPGASYVKPPEGPLYSALTESGYAPRYVKPEEFSACKVLFLPYVEAIDPPVADQLKQYVQNGGTLVAFPVIARYDGGGKPYERCPGAGLDELFGFSAGPDWIFECSPVDFPGENEAKKAFADSWFNTSGVPRDEKSEADAINKDAPIYFNMTMRCGGDPCHYISCGHQKLHDIARDVTLIGRHEDGEPLLTFRQVGKGHAICFNLLLTWPTGLQIPVTEQRETFRQAVEQLVRRFGLEPDFELRNTRGYGEGVVDFVTAQFDLPGTSTRILSMYSDWRSRPASARLLLKGGFTQVWDVRSGRRLASLPDPASGIPEALVTVGPGEWRLLALMTKSPSAPDMDAPASVEQGQRIQLAFPGASETLYGRIDAWPGDPALSSRLEHHGRSVAIPKGGRDELRVRLDDPVGEWTLRYTDGISGGVAEMKVSVKASAPARALSAAAPYPDAPMVSAAMARRGADLTDAEFIGLLDRLSAIHLDASPMDKRRYSYFTYELADSRHNTDRLLAATDWTARLEALRAHVAAGGLVYLIGEDLGRDPRSGLLTTPARNPRILEALDALVAKYRGQVLQVAGAPDLRVIRLGKGMILLDRRSPDSSGNSNLHLAAWHQHWLDEMAELGLLPGGRGTLFLPAGMETVRHWFVRQ